MDTIKWKPQKRIGYSLSNKPSEQEIICLCWGHHLAKTSLYHPFSLVRVVLVARALGIVVFREAVPVVVAVVVAPVVAVAVVVAPVVVVPVVAVAVVVAPVVAVAVVDARPELQIAGAEAGGDRVVYPLIQPVARIPQLSPCGSIGCRDVSVEGYHSLLCPK